MGKNFPQIMTLKDKPSCFEKTVQLIEKSFHYQPPNHFQTDFAPLIDESNHNNCFILIDENENVLAHIGAKEKFVELNGNKHSICLLGGIAVDEKNRGEGHFQSLMQEVLAEKRSDTATFLLWSDLEQLYRKFGFYLCGNQFEVDQAESIAGFSVTKYHSLTAAEKKNIQELYQSSFAQTYLSLERSDNDWNMIQKINSADLFIKKQADKITDYFFMNKGQDLPGVIYEYGSTRQLDHLIREAHHYGKVWMGLPLILSLIHI